MGEHLHIVVSSNRTGGSKTSLREPKICENQDSVKTKTAQRNNTLLRIKTLLRINTSLRIETVVRTKISTIKILQRPKTKGIFILNRNLHQLIISMEFIKNGQKIS